MSDQRTEMKTLPVAPRYLRRNAKRAMSGYLIRGLVELVTNARDSGYRMLGEGKMSDAEVTARPIEIVFDQTTDPTSFTVRDRFEGMTAEIMTNRLLQYGEAASGFDSGQLVRGINARGAKDVAVLGSVAFESLHDGAFAWCIIESGSFAGPEERSASEEDRRRLQIARGNGTVVRLNPFEETTIPRFSSLVQDLERHIEIRYTPAGLPRIPITIREAKSSGAGRDRILAGFQPEGELLGRWPLNLPEYDRYSDGAELRLFRTAESLSIGGRSLTRLWRAEAGILIVDGRTAHDISFLGARNADEAAASQLFGELILPQIPELLIEYDAFERAREEEADTRQNPLNPVQVTDPDRFGLNREHPFVQAVEGAARPLVEAELERLQKELTPSAGERISAMLRETLEDLGERLAEKLEVVEGGLDRGKEMPLGLSFVPGSLRLEPGVAKRAGLYLRSEPEGSPLTEISAEVSCESEAVVLAASDVTLLPSEGRPGVRYASVELKGKALTEHALVAAVVNGHTALLRISVREKSRGPIELDRDLQFSQSRYTTVPGRDKKIAIYADPSFDGRPVRLSTRNSDVTLRDSELKLSFDPELGIAVATTTVTGDSETTERARAQAGAEEAGATIVVRDLKGKPRVDFDFKDREDFGPGRRFRWDPERTNVLQLAAKHPTLSRVLGPDLHPNTGEQWPGQHDPQARAILAELIAEAYVDRRLQGELPSLGIGVENLVDPVDYENFRYQCFDEVFAVVHEALTPAYG